MQDLQLRERGRGQGGWGGGKGAEEGSGGRGSNWLFALLAEEEPPKLSFSAC